MRNSLVLLALVPLLGFAASCGTSAANSDEPASPNSDKPVDPKPDDPTDPKDEDDDDWKNRINWHEIYTGEEKPLRIDTGFVKFRDIWAGEEGLGRGFLTEDGHMIFFEYIDDKSEILGEHHSPAILIDLAGTDYDGVYYGKEFNGDSKYAPFTAKASNLGVGTQYAAAGWDDEGNKFAVAGENKFNSVNVYDAVERITFDDVSYNYFYVDDETLTEKFGAGRIELSGDYFQGYFDEVEVTGKISNSELYDTEATLTTENGTYKGEANGRVYEKDYVDKHYYLSDGQFVSSNPDDEVLFSGLWDYWSSDTSKVSK